MLSAQAKSGVNVLVKNANQRDTAFYSFNYHTRSGKTSRPDLLTSSLREFTFPAFGWRCRQWKAESKVQPFTREQKWRDADFSGTGKVEVRHRREQRCRQPQIWDSCCSTKVGQSPKQHGDINRKPIQWISLCSRWFGFCCVFCCWFW